ncbi:Phosphorylated carbohydrates phosphatase [Hordeum vulgare]|nr:Phosphorylated carbohydrates phosphatase [Hordeum vulgare]
MSREPDEDERLLAWMYRRSLTTTETDARRLRRKNAGALRLAIEQSEREANELAKEKARLVKMKREKDMVVHRMNSLIVLSDSDSDDGDNGTSSSDDQDPAAADGYSCADDPKGKGSARKWSFDPAHLRIVYIVFSCSNLRIMSDELEMIFWLMF